MRIVLDLQACQAEDGGRASGRYSLSLARAIARNAGKHEIVVALNSRFPASVERLRVAFDGLLPRDRVVVFSVPRSAAAIGPASDWRRHAAAQVRSSFLAGLRPDVVHISSLFVGLNDDSVASVTGGYGPAAVTASLSDLDLLDRSSVKEQRSNWRLSKLEEARHADLLLVTSNHAAELAMATLGVTAERIVSVPAGAEETLEPRTLPPDEHLALLRRSGIVKPFVLARVGADEPGTVEALIRAFALLPEAIRQRHQLALVAGPADGERQKLTAAVMRLGPRGDDVAIASGVSDDELMALYGASTLVISASESDCLGSSALAAMTCGAPVIASMAGAMPEVIGRSDALFDLRDHHAMGSLIGEVLADDGLRRDLKDHGSRQARRFTWDGSATRALEAFARLHERRQPGRVTAVEANRPRPRLAFVSPLPPERSGIADYSAELLPELARHYDIDVVLQQASLDAPWVAANCAIRSVAWFDAHADEYDRIVYQFGNSPYHEHMFALLVRHPGVVVLHDFFLSGAVHYRHETRRLPGGFTQALYESHGYAAITDERQIGREAAVWKYPCNKEVLDRAEGVIVHSRFAMRLADAWYGPGSAGDWKHIPLARAQPPAIERRAARERLGIADADFLVCSLGMLWPSKLNDRLLDAWLASPLADDPRCRLAFVGENQSTQYCKDLASTIRGSRSGRRIRITGFAPRELYEDYLAAADMAVQLRALSRGETSASVLDCLGRGVPTIANVNGSVAELPDGALLKIPDEFTQVELGDALVRLWRDPDARAALARRGTEHVRTVHAPAAAADLYRDAIEEFATASRGARYRHLLRSLGGASGLESPPREDRIEVAAAVAANRPAAHPRQILVDITAIVRNDIKTGIERVTRAVLKALLDRPPDGYRVEPVYDADGHYAYARRFTARLLGVEVPDLQDSLLEATPGDVFLGLSLCWDSIPQGRPWLVDLRNRGVRVFFVMYDLLPILRPEVFPGFVQPAFARWLDTVTDISDGIVCISRAVADEFLDWLQRTTPERFGPLGIGYFHLGADVAASLPSRGTEPNAEQVIRHVSARPAFLMVGTVEPRKGHAQALSAFERLWAAGVDASLVIVGNEGWDVGRLAARMRAHPERGRRLHVLHGVSDEVLLRLYESASALLAASEGEGFGLPLIEAAQHGMPIIARDLPVFREVAGEHAFYFTGRAPEDLADAISAWLALRERGEAPSSRGMPWLSWTQSTAQLLDVILGGRWYERWHRAAAGAVPSQR